MQHEASGQHFKTRCESISAKRSFAISASPTESVWEAARAAAREGGARRASRSPMGLEIVNEMTAFLCEL